MACGLSPGERRAGARGNSARYALETMLLQSFRQVLLRFAEVRLELQGLAKLANPFFQCALRCPGHSQVVVCFGIIAVGGERFPKVTDRLRQLLSFREDHSQVIPGLGKARVAIKRLSIFPFGARQLALPFVYEPQV